MFLRVWRWLQARGPAQLVYELAAGLLLSLGVLLRSNRYWFDALGLWMDEAAWARRLFRPSLTNYEFRPIGYMNVTRLAAHVYCDEHTIRILSYSAGLASLFFVFDISRLLFRSRAARLVCLATVVFQPFLIDMAREFKPYSEEFCVHLGLIWLFLRWRATGARGWFWALLGCSVFAFLFAYNIVFLLPAIFSILGVTFLKQRDYRSLTATVLAAVAALLLMLSVYFVALREPDGDSDGAAKFWGNKYDVFYLANGRAQARAPQSHVSWIAHKYLGLVTFPNTERDQWRFPAWVSPAVSDGLVTLDYYAWMALHAAGLIALSLRGRRTFLVLLASPLIVIIGFNWFGVWPFGVFRTNTFLLAYYVLIPMAGLDLLIRWSRGLGSVVVLASCLLFLVPNFSVGFDWHTYKRFGTGHAEIRTLFRRLRELRDAEPDAARQEKSHLLLDVYSCAPVEFYTRYDDTTRREFGSYISDNFEFNCTQSNAASQAMMRQWRGKSYFVVVTDDRQRAAFQALVSKHARVISKERVRDAHDLYFVTGK